jgi:hypothetical protein
MELSHPEKISTHGGVTTYFVKLVLQTVVGGLRIQCGKITESPDLHVQDIIQKTKNEVLQSLVQNRAMFRTPPTLTSLQAIATGWGFMILENGKRIEWSPMNIWFSDKMGSDIAQKTATFELVLRGVQISRQAIRPVWEMKDIQVLPEHDPIDLDFGEEDVGDAGSDISSVDSIEIATAVATDSQPFALRDKGERKRLAKREVRAVLARATEARIAADDAVDRFYTEFDLSEDESDFSDDE